MSMNNCENYTLQVLEGTQGVTSDLVVHDVAAVAFEGVSGAIMVKKRCDKVNP